MAMQSTSMLFVGSDNGVHRLLNAKVIDGIPVVGEDDVYQVFTDVVHISFDSGDRHFPFVEPSSLSMWGSR